MNRCREIIRLAASDVRHEWRMSLCMMLAVAAIATPLLLFFGLKYGIIETLRQRLLADPSSMEILPLTDKRLDEAWFEQKRGDPRVAFVVPHTRRLSAQAEFSLQGKNIRVMLDISPTLKNDTLLLRYGVPVPKAGECVLTTEAAAKLKAGAGDTLVCQVSRDRGKVRASRPFSVSAVLPGRAGALPAAYIRLEELEQIEQFKDGRAVPELGWPGSDPLAYPAAPGALVALSSQLDAVREAMLCQNTGFTSMKRLEDARGDFIPLGLPEGHTLYLLSTVGGMADSRDFAAVADRVRGNDAYILPINGTLKAILPAEGGEETFVLLPAAAIGRSLPGVSLPEEEQSWTEFSSKPAPRLLLVAPDAANRIGSREVKAKIVSTIPAKDGSIQEREITINLNVQAVESVPPGKALAAPSLLGQLGLLAERPLLDGKTASGEPALLLGRRGYSGFRMYAAGLEQVAPMKAALEHEGITVSTRADRIEEVLALNKYLNILFWIIAAASLAGGMGCLISNVYANVERKRRELAVLCLLGVHGLRLSLFPLTSAIILTLGGILGSLTLFHALAAAINSVFSAHLAEGELFCRLTFTHQLAALGMALALAVLTGLAASRRMLRIQPAESLRDE